jgi:hypothetical protein
LPGQNAGDAVNLMRSLAGEALGALNGGCLVIDEGSLAPGWVEVFAELT